MLFQNQIKKSLKILWYLFFLIEVRMRQDLFFILLLKTEERSNMIDS